MCCSCTSLTNTRQTNTDRMTGQDVKPSFCSCAVAVGLRRVWASLSIITAHDPSVHRATWPQSTDQAPTVFLHMPDLSLRDTALSKKIHCSHEQQRKLKCSYSSTMILRERLNVGISKSPLFGFWTGLVGQMRSNMVNEHLFDGSMQL